MYLSQYRTLCVLITFVGLTASCGKKPSGACVSVDCVEDPASCDTPTCYDVEREEDCQTQAGLTRQFEFAKEETCESLGYTECEFPKDVLSYCPVSMGGAGAGGAGGAGGAVNP